jgi:3-hydroxyacyl-[acyl-carrier-protein] dehydratase
MIDEIPHYPFVLDRPAIEALLPHRGDIFVGQHLSVEGPHRFLGMAQWSSDNGLIQGHFPGLPVVPGVMLIETMAQLAGAGLLAGDPYVRSLPGDLIGVLATVRKCVFKHPVLPQQVVEFAIQCRQMTPMAVQVCSTVYVGAVEVAQLDVVLVHTSRRQLLSAMGAAGQPPDRELNNLG